MLDRLRLRLLFDLRIPRLSSGVVCQEMDYAEIAQAIVTLLAIPEPWVLSIDRTDWQFGDCVFNILISTHLTNAERLSKLLALLSLALCWAILIGEWLHQLDRYFMNLLSF